MTQERNDELAQLWDKIKAIRVAMLCTMEEDGSHRSRPMYTQDQNFSGTIWFYTYEDSHKVLEVEKEREVNLAYSEPQKNIFVSVSGTARVVKDRAMLEKYWNKSLEAWFPDGLETPGICLLAVDTHYAEYWDSPGSRVVQAFGMLKSIAKGEEYNPGENVKITV